jgi:hypothetical protein
MIIQVANAQLRLEQAEGMCVLIFVDHVVRQRGGQAELVPTGVEIQIGPMSAALARQMCQGMLDDLSPVAVPRSDVVSAPLRV